jgi:hypothetical protein
MRGFLRKQAICDPRRLGPKRVYSEGPFSRSRGVLCDSGIVSGEHVNPALKSNSIFLCPIRSL